MAERASSVPAILPRTVWRLLLAIGAATWIVASVITGVTEDAVLLPSSSCSAASSCRPRWSRSPSRDPRGAPPDDRDRAARSWAAGARALFAAVTEVYLLPTAYGTFFGVGLIEESTKAIMLIAWRAALQYTTARGDGPRGDGGRRVAAFEKLGYALEAFLENATTTASEHRGTEAVRAVSAPFGRIMSTAVLGGALFAAWAGGHPHLKRRVCLTFLGVVVLRAISDASNGWTITLTQGILGDGLTLDSPQTKDWVGFPTGQELEVCNTISFALLVILAAHRDAVARAPAGGRTRPRLAVELTADALGGRCPRTLATP